MKNRQCAREGHRTYKQYVSTSAHKISKALQAAQRTQQPRDLNPQRSGTWYQYPGIGSRPISVTGGREVSVGMIGRIAHSAKSLAKNTANREEVSEQVPAGDTSVFAIQYRGRRSRVTQILDVGKKHSPELIHHEPSQNLVSKRDVDTG